jgi:MFS family permease
MTEGLSEGLPAPARSLYPARRIAVALLFLANGLYIGAWSPKVPEIAERLGLTPLYVGLMLVLFGLGSIIIMPIAGSRIARYEIGRAHV